MEILRYIRNGLCISSNETHRLRRKHTESVLKEKKLILILDLDSTLLHTEYVSNLSPDEDLFIDLAEDDPTMSIFKWDGNMVTKLRPFIRTFLEEASQMYDMYIYTMGTRAYAAQMCRFLDPDGVCFESKVISREDCTRPGQKGLDVVLAEERVVAIVDDNESVWENHMRNLIRIERYEFFGLGYRLFDEDDNVLREFEDQDESELDGGLANTLEVLKLVHRLFFHPAVSADFLANGDVRRVLELPEDEVLQGSMMDVDDFFDCVNSKRISSLFEEKRISREIGRISS